MANAAQAHRNRRRQVLNYRLIKAENGFLVEKQEAKNLEAARHVFLFAHQVADFFEREARALEEPVEKKLSPVLDYPSPKVVSGKPGMQPPLRLSGAKKPPCPECGSTFKHWMSCSEYTGHL